MRALTPHPGGKAARHRAIRRLLAAREVGTQEELVSLLAREGFEVTQATLSRDLAQLGAVRVSRPSGGTVYDLNPAALPPEPVQIAGVADLVLDLDHNDLLCVIRTRPGAASAIALMVDGARIPECLGTLAGDDTIFATPTRGTSARRLLQRLRSILGKEVR